MDRWIDCEGSNGRVVYGRRGNPFHQGRCTWARAAVELPVEPPYQRRQVYQFVIRAGNRDGSKKRLAEHGIGSEVY